ncbi:hypothetical protein EJB05_52510, partial [Eragrostis curvula]
RNRLIRKVSSNRELFQFFFPSSSSSGTVVVLRRLCQSRCGARRSRGRRRGVFAHLPGRQDQVQMWPWQARPERCRRRFSEPLAAPSSPLHHRTARALLQCIHRASPHRPRSTLLSYPCFVFDMCSLQSLVCTPKICGQR